MPSCTIISSRRVNSLKVELVAEGEVKVVLDIFTYKVDGHLKVCNCSYQWEDGSGEGCS